MLRLAHQKNKLQSVPRIGLLKEPSARRSAARNLRRSGIPETVIMSIGGWKTRSVFTRYAIVDETDVVEAMRRFRVGQPERCKDGAN